MERLWNETGKRNQKYLAKKSLSVQLFPLQIPRGLALKLTVNSAARSRLLTI